MGNKASLFIELDHGNDVAIEAGKSLKGKVVLNVQRKLPAGELVLRLVGSEYTIIPSRKGTQREERVIARAFTKLNLFQGKRNVKKGLYSQPFEFLLPASLPSSTQFPKAEGKNFNGRIQYRLSAEMGDFCVDSIFHVVSAPLGDNVVPCMIEPASHELKKARVLNKGYLSIGACVSNSHVGRGQSIKVSVSSRNDSLCDIERVRVKLVEKIEYKAQGEPAEIKQQLYEEKDVNLPNLRRQRSSGSLRVNKRNFIRTKSATYSEILSDLVAGENTFKVPIPKTARDSYDGNLITISHFLKITYYTGALTENPSTTIPIVVGSPRDEEPDTADFDDMTTVVGEDPVQRDVPEVCEASIVSVGYDIPMAEAYILPPPSAPEAQSPNTVYPLNDGARVIGPARILPYGSSDDEDEDDEELFIARPMPVPSAPHESLLTQSAPPTTPPREILGRHSQLGGSLQHNHSPANAYAPYAMYSSNSNKENDRNRARFDSLADKSVGDSSAESSYQVEAMRNRFDTHSYDDTTAISELTEAHHRPQLGHAQLPYNTPVKEGNNSQQQLLQRLIRELRASIHDYEVVSSKTRIAAYRELYSSLTPKEFALIISTVGMSYQVQVAVLLARSMVYTSSFTCNHIAEAVKKTSSFFRANMVEALIPYANDITKNRSVIDAELSDWERCVTARAFQNMK